MFELPFVRKFSIKPASAPRELVVFTSTLFSKFLYVPPHRISTQKKNVPGTSDLTKKRRVRDGHKSHVTMISASQLYYWQQKIRLQEKLAAIKILHNQILDLLETEQDIDHEINESSKSREGIYTILLQINDKLKQLDITASGGGNGNSAQPS